MITDLRAVLDEALRGKTIRKLGGKNTRKIARVWIDYEEEGVERIVFEFEGVDAHVSIGLENDFEIVEESPKFDHDPDRLYPVDMAAATTAISKESGE